MMQLFPHNSGLRNMPVSSLKNNNNKKKEHISRMDTLYLT